METTDYERRPGKCYCFSMKPSLAVFVIGLITGAASVVYLTYYITAHDSQLFTTQDVPPDLENFLKKVSAVDWCLNDTVDRSSISYQLNVTSVGMANPSYTLKCKVMTDLPWSAVNSSEELLNVYFYLRHNHSTSTRHSTNVLIPSYMGLKSNKSLPTFHSVDDCVKDLEMIMRDKPPSSAVTHCSKQRLPMFHIDPRWNIEVEWFLTLDKYSLHLMYTSYFLFMTVVIVIIFTVVKSRLRRRSPKHRKYKLMESPR